MKKALVFLLGLTAVVAFGATERSDEAERYYEEEFPVDAGVTFSLDSYKGTIRIRTDSVPVIKARARIYLDDNTDPALLDHVQIKTRNREDFVSLEVEYDQPSVALSGLFGQSVCWPLVDWDIVLPDDADLEVESHKSRFDLEVPSGRVEIESHKGEGTIYGVRNDLELETHKGTFEVEVLELGDINVETHKGNISLTLHEAHDFDLQAESHKGEFRFKGRNIPVKREDGELFVDYQAGRGENRIELETHKGTITLKFLD